MILLGAVADGMAFRTQARNPEVMRRIARVASGALTGCKSC
jgi:hypothetical protein